jgi:hypothetical protein
MLEKAKRYLGEIRTLIVAIGLWMIPWLLVEYGIKIVGYPGIPDTVVTMYMALVWVGVVMYISVDQQRARQFIASLKKVWVALLALPPLIVANLVAHGPAATLSALIVPPLLVGNFVSSNVATIQPPPERSAPPGAERCSLGLTPGIRRSGKPSERQSSQGSFRR